MFVSIIIIIIVIITIIIGRRRERRLHRNSWKREVTTAMREKGINNMEWGGREERRRKIKLKL